jgi:gliding motility-associated-like protein
MKNYSLFGIAFFVISILFFGFETKAQTLIMNEVSNGPAGNQEYVEFVVVSDTITYSCTSPTPPCIDIRGWIFDDNSGYHGTSGIAAGAVRFSNNILWSCVPVGTIIVIYNNGDPNPAMLADDLSLADGNCKIVAPLNSLLFESNATTPGASACSYPAVGWTPGGSWANTLLANAGDCARIVNLAGCEVFSVCWASDNLNNLIYFASGGSGSQNVWYFNGIDPTNQANWSEGSTTPSPGAQTPGAPNNAANAAYINQFNNGCLPITPINVTATFVNAGCSCTGTATASATGSIPGYTYTWYNSAFLPISQTAATAIGLCAGVYNVVATSSIGCMDTATVTITSTSTTSVTVNSQSICAGASTSLTAIPSLGGGTFSWSPGVLTTQTISLSPATTTTYTVTYTLAGCSSTGTGTVTVSPLPLTTVNSPTICAGQTATLTAAGATTYAWSTGATTNPISVTPVTTTSYTVTGTSLGCTSTAIATVTVNPLPVTTVNSLTICAGATATLTAAGATTYAWSIGASTNPISVTPATTTSYTVTGTSLGCTSTAIATVTVNPLPITIVNSPTICPASTANLVAGGATTYTWTAGANPTGVSTAAAFPATTISYTVTGTSLGCTSTAVATVTVASALVVSVNSPTICNGINANLTAGGATTYTWTAGATATSVTTADAAPTTTTSYTVTGTTGGCAGTAVATVTVNPIPVTIVNSPTICNGITANLTAGGATTYTWSAGATSTGATTADASPSITTSYTVSGTSLGCTSSAVATITVNPIPVTTVNSPSVCPTFTANLVAGGATTYTWTAGVTATGVNTGDATPAVTTTYTVTGTSLACSSTAVATVTVNTTLVVNAGLNDTICFGGSTILNATPNGAGYTFLWSPAAGLSSTTIFNPVANPGTTILYTLAITDPSGCVGTDDVTIYSDPEITLALAGIDVTCNGTCNGQTIVIPAGGTPAYTYAWSSGCAAASCSPLCIGTYTVTVSDSWGCTASGTATIIEPTLLTATISGTTPTTCNALCDGTATAIGAGGTMGAGYSYSWNTVPAQTTATATGLCAGTYICTITDANACTATVTATIAEPALVVIAPIAPAMVCTGGTTTLTASASGGNGGAYNYTWLPAGTGTTPSVVVTPAGTTTYTVNATDLNGCPAAAVTVTVTVNPPLAVVASGTTSICPGASASISAVASLGSGGPYTYTWAPAGSGTPLTVSPTVTTTYTVTASDGCSPNVTATVTVTVLPSPVVAFSAPVTSGCAPLCVIFADNTTVTVGAVATWNWDFGDGSTSTSSAPTNCYSSEGSYTVTLSVTDIDGCESEIIQNNYINVFPIPNAAFSSNPFITDIFNPTITFNNESTNASFYQWDFGDMSSSNQTNPEHTFGNEGQYSILLIATSSNGCVDSAIQTIQINGVFTFYAPNAFTPNDDNTNNIFLPKGTGWNPEKFNLMIFDRWGNRCYETRDMNKGWDGRANNGSEVAQEDVYVWKVFLTDIFDKKHSYMGSVTIVK